MRRKIEFVDDEIYHVYARGVEKRTIFLDNRDYFRFVNNLYEFNDEEPADNFYYKKAALNSYALRPRERKPLVEILIFCLMQNHFHLLLRQLKEGGISKFMQKLGGYTWYFNKKYDRVGPLFQGRFGALHVKDEPHLIHLPVYIHLNPLDLVMPEWRSHGVKDMEKALEYIRSYRWSSHLDYLGDNNFPLVTSRGLINEIFESTDRYLDAISSWIAEPKPGLIEEHLTC